MQPTRDAMISRWAVTGPVEDHHAGAEQSADNGADAEAGVEPGHDGPARLSLDVRALHVHRDRPGRQRESEQQEPEDE